jgi:endoribonuclease LACTB2
MVDIVEHPGVTEWRFSSRISRAVGFTASAFRTASGVLIDTGIPAARHELATLLTTAPVRGVIVTHHHEDHAGNAEWLASEGIPLWIADSTRAMVRNIAPLRAYRRYTWTPMPPLRSDVTAFEPESLQIIPTPGHSVDHHVVWDSSTRTLYAGDLFLSVAVRIAHHGEDPWASIASLDRAAALEPERLFDAHRGIVHNAAGALRAKAAWTRTIIAQITDRIGAGDSNTQILRTVLGGESLTGRLSGGEYSRRNFIRNVRDRVSGASGDEPAAPAERD